MPLRVLPVLLGLSLGLLPVPEGAGAQAWTQPEGGLYLKLSRSHVSAARQWDFDGTEKPYAPGVAGEAFFDRSVYLYGEYGLSSRWTLVALLPFKRITVHDARFAYTTEGLGSAVVGLRAGLSSLFGVPLRRAAAAFTVAATVPLGYTRNRSPALGPGQADVQASFSYGLSLHPAPAYLQGALGFRLRSGFYGFSRAITCTPDRVPVDCVADERPDYADEWLFSGEAGLSLGGWGLVQALAHGVWSNQPPETGFNPVNPLPTRTRYVKVGGGLTLYPLPPVGLSVQVLYTSFGRNTIRSTDWFFGLEYRAPPFR